MLQSRNSRCALKALTLAFRAELFIILCTMFVVAVRYLFSRKTTNLYKLFAQNVIKL